MPVWVPHLAQQPLTSFSGFVAGLLARHGATVSQWAYCSGVDSTLILHYLQGDCEPRSETVWRLFRILDDYPALFVAPVTESGPAFVRRVVARTRTKAHAARVLGVDCRQVTRWASGENSPSRAVRSLWSCYERLPEAERRRRML